LTSLRRRFPDVRFHIVGLLRLETFTFTSHVVLLST